MGLPIDASLLEGVGHQTEGPASALTPQRIFLRHHDCYARWLLYDRQTGEALELSRAQRPEGARLFTGFYVVLKEEVIGVHASLDGPVFFRSAERMLLKPGCTSARVIHLSSGLRRFELTLYETLVCALEYCPPPPGGSPYDDDLMADFFAWLADGLSRGGLFLAYTVDGDAALWDEP